MSDEKFIFDRIEKKDLWVLRSRNREIVKVWARLQGYKNIQYRYLLVPKEKQKGAAEVIKGIGEEFSNKLERSKKILNMYNSPADLLIYRKSTQEWQSIVIIDEYELVTQSKRDAYDKAFDCVRSELNPMFILIGVENSTEYLQKLLDFYSNRLDYGFNKELLTDISSLYKVDLDENNIDSDKNIFNNTKNSTDESND